MVKHVMNWRMILNLYDLFSALVHFPCDLLPLVQSPVLLMHHQGASITLVAGNKTSYTIPAVLTVYVFTSYPCQWVGDVLQFLEITIASVELAILYILFVYIFENFSHEMTFFKMLPFPLILIRPNLAEWIVSHYNMEPDRVSRFQKFSQENYFWKSFLEKLKKLGKKSCSQFAAPMADQPILYWGTDIVKWKALF